MIPALPRGILRLLSVLVGADRNFRPSMQLWRTLISAFSGDSIRLPHMVPTSNDHWDVADSEDMDPDTGASRAPDYIKRLPGEVLAIRSRFR